MSIRLPYQDGYQRYNEKCGVEVGHEVRLAVGVVREDSLRKAVSTTSCTSIQSAITPTLARKLDAVHRNTVRNSNSSPTIRLYFPSLPRNPFALPDPRALAPSPIVLRSLSSAASNRSATLPGTGGSRLAIVIVRWPDKSASNPGIRITKVGRLCSGLWRESAHDRIREVPIASGSCRCLHGRIKILICRVVGKESQMRQEQVRRYRLACWWITRGGQPDTLSEARSPEPSCHVGI